MSAVGDALATVDWGSMLSGLFSGLFNNFVIGDQVPDYPIKSKTTLQGIITNIKNAYPDPANKSEAMAMLNRALSESEAAHAQAVSKGSVAQPYAVDETYAMILREVADALELYINGAPYDGSIGDGGNTGTNNNNSPSIKKPNNTVIFIIVGVVLLAIVIIVVVSMSGKKK